jgi:hypothetical protein
MLARVSVIEDRSVRVGHVGKTIMPGNVVWLFHWLVLLMVGRGKHMLVAMVKGVLVMVKRVQIHAGKMWHKVLLLLDCDVISESGVQHRARRRMVVGMEGGRMACSSAANKAVPEA